MHITTLIFFNHTLILHAIKIKPTLSIRVLWARSGLAEGYLGIGRLRALKTDALGHEGRTFLR